MLRSRRLIGAGVLIAAVAWPGLESPSPTRSATGRSCARSSTTCRRSPTSSATSASQASTSARSELLRRVGDHAEVDLLLDQHMPVYRNARAVLRPHTPFEGTTFIDLDPGHPGATLLGSSPIPLSQTTVFVSAGELFSTFTAPVRHGFQVIVRELSRGLGPPGQQGLSAALHNAPALLRQTSPRGACAPRAACKRAENADSLAVLDRRCTRRRKRPAPGAVHNAARTLDAVAAGNAMPFDRSPRLYPARWPTSRRPAATSSRSSAAPTRPRGSLAGTFGQIPSTTGPLTAPFSEPTRRSDDPTDDQHFSASLSNLARAGPGARPVVRRSRPWPAPWPIRSFRS